jgi:glycosyltransferase involved in cell wall biosynthesis/GT2 family glycosyltransferase
LRIALVSREVYPLGGGGIGQFVSAAARLLATEVEVTVLTSSVHRGAYEQMREAEDPRLPPPGVRVEFVEEPWEDEFGSFFSIMHCYGARAYERLRELYPDGGPDLVEFPDFLGEGSVTIQAAETLDPFLEASVVCVRAHTSAEMCEVLNGRMPDDFPTRATFALERLTLGRADRLLWQGGDVLGTYERFYGSDFLAPAERVRYPFHGPAPDPSEDEGFQAGDPLRLLFLGRFERRKGVRALIRAASGLDRDDWRLTLVGHDTPTGPLGTSMREQLLLAAADDPRIEIADPVERSELPRLVREHDAVVLPSLWECWPYAALEAMHLNRPVIGTPTGGLVEMVVPGRSGWLARGTDFDSLASCLEEVIEDRDVLERMVRAGEPAAVARSLAPDEEVLASYRRLVREGTVRRPRTPANGRPPLVTAIVPYHRTAAFVAETIASLDAQVHPRMEVILVNDGSFDEPDWILAELAARYPLIVVTQQNAGLGAARNLGVRMARGEYVFPLDADNAAEPSFVARCLEVLEARPELSYVTAWSRYIDPSGNDPGGEVEGFQPLGAGPHAIDANSFHNLSGDAAAVIRRRVFELGFRYSEELTSYEDWHFYRELERAGHRGAVIPQRLIRYRVHEEQMTRQVALENRSRLEAEMEAHMRENAIRWTSSSG